MIKGTGIDIIEIKRIEKAMNINKFKTKCFTNLELDLINKKGIITAAANFCAKEAVSKALGIGFKKFLPKDIEILRDKYGSPYVNLYSKAKEFAKNKNIISIKISLSHCKKYATAFCIIE